MNVTMPDGNVIQDVPEGTTQTQLSSKYQSYQQQQPTPQVAPTGEQQVQQGMKNTMAGFGNFTKGLDEFGSEIGTAAHSSISNTGNLVSEVQAKLQGPEAVKQYEQSPERADTQALNVKNTQNIAQLNTKSGTFSLPYFGNKIGAGDVANFIGSSLPYVPLGTTMGLGGATASRLGMGTGLSAKLTGNAINDEVIGQAAATGAPTNASTVDESLQKSKDIAKTTAWLAPIAGASIRGVAKGAEWASSGVNYLKSLGNRDIAKTVKGQEALTDIPPEKQDILRDFAKQNPNSTMTSAEVTLDPKLAAEQSNLKSYSTQQGKTVTPAIDLTKNNLANKNTVANELQQLNIPNTSDIRPIAEQEVGAKQAEISQLQASKAPEYKNPQVENAPLPIQAQAQTGAAARDLSSIIENEKNAAYKAIAPDDTVQAPLAKLQYPMEIIQQKNPELIEADPKLREITERYLNEEDSANTGSVRQMIQDKNALGKYVNGLYNSFDGSQTAAQRDVTEKTIQAAQQMRDALKEHLSGLNDVPSGVEDKSVGEAFNEAEDKFKEQQQKFFENPDQYRINAEGKKYGFAASEFSKYDYRLNEGKAGTLEQEGKNLLSFENPEKLSSQLATIRNFDDADGLVKSNALALMKSKGIESFTPEAQYSLEQKGFGQVSKELQDIVKDVKGNNYTIEQRNSYFDAMANSEKDKLEQSFAGKLLKSANTDVAGLLKDKNLQKEAIDLANKQNDGSATLRGLGASVLDKIKADSIETGKQIEGEVNPSTGMPELKDTKSINSKSISESLNKYSDILKQTLGTREFNTINDFYKRAEQLEYVEKFAKPTEGSTSVSVAESPKAKLVRGGAGEIYGKTRLGPTMAINTFFSSIRSKFTNSYNEAAHLATNPSNLVQFMDMAKNQSPDRIKAFIDGMMKINTPGLISGQTGEKGNKSSTIIPNQGPLKVTITPEDKKDTPKVNLPQVKNEVPNEKNNHSQSASNDNSIKLPPEYTQKKSEFQIADASKQTGMSPDFINAIKKAETGRIKNADTAVNPSPDSSAAGAHQFTVGTWNDQAKKHGLPQVTDDNEGTENDPRFNPKYSSLATGYYGKSNYNQLDPYIKSTFNRETTIRDLTEAHFIGASSVKKLLAAPDDAIAKDILPKAAKDNPSRFNSKSGAPLTVKQFHKHTEDIINAEG